MRWMAWFMAMSLLAACASAGPDTGLVLEDLVGERADLTFTEEELTWDEVLEEGFDGDPVSADELDGQPLTPGTPGQPQPRPDAERPGGPTGPDAEAAPAPGQEAPTVPTTAQARGVTDTQILIGFEYSEGMAAALAGAGYDSGGEPPDEVAGIQALVRWVNANGGIAGREVVPVIHGTNPVSGTFSAQAQAACTRWTEDHQVFAAASNAIAGTDELAACMARRQTPFIEHNYWPYTERHHRQWRGYFYQPGRMSAERGWPAAVDGLAAAGFFQDARVGIVTFDHPHFRDLTDRLVKPRMERHGVEIADEAHISFINSYPQVTQVSAQLNNVILRFRAAGVTHVFFVEYQGLMPFFFLTQAESQRWRPGYGLSSFSVPITTAKNSPEEQLENAMVVGWDPAGDTKNIRYPDDHAAMNRCLDILRDAGVLTGYDGEGYYYFPHCDTLFFLRDALARAPELTPAGLLAGASALGTSYQSPQSWVTRLGPDRLAGSDAWRLAPYERACDCFVHTTPPQRTP